MAVKAMATITLTRIEVGGRNLIVLSNILVGQYLNNSTGVVASAGSHAATDFIAARPLTEYILSGVDGVQQVRFVSYDNDQKFISGVLYSGDRGDSQIYKTPANTGYIRVSADFTTKSHYNDWMLEKGNMATDWTEAPEDTQAKIDKRVDGIDEQLGGFVTVDGYSAEIGAINSALQDYKAQLEAGEISRDAAITEIVALVDKTAVIETDLGEFTEKWKFLDTSITFGAEGILVGDTVSNTGVRIAAGRIDFVDNGAIVADITGQLLTIKRGIFVTSAQIGEHQIETIEGGHTIWKWMP